MSESHRELESWLIDLTEISLVELRSLDDSVLTHALRRVLEEAANPQDAIAEWDSSIWTGNTPGVDAEM